MTETTWHVAPTDNAEPFVEHALSLTGLGPEGLLIALAIVPQESSIASLVKNVEIIRHGPLDVVNEKISTGIEQWNAAEKVDRESLSQVTMLDPRAYAENFRSRTLNRAHELELTVIAACWIINQRLRGFINEYFTRSS